jgi:hypothetical protein
MAIGPLGTYTDFQRGWRAEYVQRIERVLPKYYVVENAIDLESNIPTMGELMGLDGFPALINSCYRLDTTIGNYLIFVKK